MPFTLTSFDLFCCAWMLIALLVHITMFFVKAPFGRHTSDQWGISINNKAGWVIMEMPSLLIMLYFLFSNNAPFISYSWLLFFAWVGHYFNRTFIYPIRIKSTPKKIPLLIVFNAILFNVINSGMNGYYLTQIAPLTKYDSNWLLSVHFIVGSLLFLTGAFINIKADNMLIRLRKPGDTGYSIPHGFLFKYITSPNLMGEIIEWGGFALMAWNLPAFTFFIWTFANLVPRAKNHHDWYHAKFENYPKERKVIFPFLY